ncbi:hypothetical protein Leryth_007162 [Lithospermum erythrorhizon]|nr:hypothetical protein Leryth_007162 [Lithospermum erythrorhizon]
MYPPPLLLLLLLSLSTSATSIEVHELQRSLTVLRSRGYSLFSNAIATSEILDDVVSSHSSATFTFFAPTDFSLFKLDMTGSAEDYINTLRCHVIPHRITAAQLRQLPVTSTFDTLMKGRQIDVEVFRSDDYGGDDVIMVNGVVVDFPGLYYSRNVAVHGLGGILNVTGGSGGGSGGGGGELNNSLSDVALHRHPPASPANLSAASPLPPLNSSSGDSSGGGGDRPELNLPPPAVAVNRHPPDSTPPALTGKNNAFASRRLISGGDGSGLKAVTAEDITGVMEMLHADLEKWDGRIFDCLLTDNGHVSTPHGYLYTRQQSHTSMLSCAGLHEFLHLQHF